MASPAPRVSVVVFARDDPSRARAAVASLLAQDGIGEAEVVVADGTRGNVLASLAAEHAAVRHLPLAPAPMPVLKAAAVRASRAPVVAILDPTDDALPGWIRAILREFPDDPRVAGIGGEVEVGGATSASNRAAYLFEYGAFAPPMRPGPTDGDLPGNNVAYRRSALVDDCADLLARGFWKPFFHERLRAAGRTFHAVPSMRVRHVTDHRLLPFSASRSRYGRCFGAMRVRLAPAARRWKFRLGAPLVPFLVAGKQFLRALRHPARRRLLVRSAPALLWICAAWSLGECVGIWFGEGGACERVH